MWFAVSGHAQAQPPPACRMPFQLCLGLQAAHSTYWLTTDLKRTTDVSKPFSDKTLSNHTGLPQISRQAWWWHQRQYMWVERLEGRKELLIQAKGTRSFEGKQAPWCLCGFLGFLVVNNKSITFCFLPILPVFEVIMDLPDASKVHILQWCCPPTWQPGGCSCPDRSQPWQKRDASGEPSDKVHRGSPHTEPS